LTVALHRDVDGPIAITGEDEIATIQAADALRAAGRFNRRVRDEAEVKVSFSLDRIGVGGIGEVAVVVLLLDVAFTGIENQNARFLVLAVDAGDA
jgi:hypothetical protein